MKIISSRQIVGVVSIVGVLVSTLALPAGAVPVSGKPVKAVDESNFCQGLSGRQASFESSLSSRVNTLNSNWTTQNTNLQNRWKQVDQTVASDRATADSKRAADITKLEAKATTSTEKTAVTTFQQAVQKAVTTRRGTVDQARTTFRNSVLAAIEGRRSVIMGQAQTFESSVSAAFQTADQACAANSGSAATIRMTLIGTLKTNRETYTTDRKSDARLASQVSALATTRNQAISGADTAMKAAVHAAAAQLKTAFGEASNSTGGAV